MHLNSKQCWQAYQRKGNKKARNPDFHTSCISHPLSLLSLIMKLGRVGGREKKAGNAPGKGREG